MIVSAGRMVKFSVMAKNVVGDDLWGSYAKGKLIQEWRGSYWTKEREVLRIKHKAEKVAS